MCESASKRMVIIYDVLLCYYLQPQDCLGIQNVSRQESGVCSGVNFLLNHRVLYEISAFGLQDSAEKVSKGTHLIFSGSYSRRNFCVSAL